MAAWRKEEVDAARHRQRKREARDWESCYRTPKRRILTSDTHWPSRRVERILYGRETDRDLRSA